MKKPRSFQVVPNKEMFFCQGCGAGGDVIKFIELFNNCDFKRACEILGGELDGSDTGPARVAAKTSR